MLVCRAAFLLSGAASGSLGCAWFWDETSAGGPSARSVQRPRDQPSDDDPSVLIPAGMQSVIEVNMAQVRTSPWLQPVLEGRNIHDRARKAEALGYDDIADVDRLFYAITAAGPDAPTLVVARGRFSAPRVEEAFRDRWPDAVVDHWRGLSVLSRGENALAFLTARTFASGSPASVRAVIDRAFGIGQEMQADGMMGPIRRAVSPQGSPPEPVLLATVAVDARLRARAGDALAMPPELRQLGIRADFGAAVTLSAVGLLDNPEAAATLARRLRGMIEDPVNRRALQAVGLSGLAAQAHVSVVGARVMAHLSLDEESRPAVAALLRAFASADAGTARSTFGSW